MEHGENIFIIILAILNFVMGTGGALLIAKLCDRIEVKSIGIFRYSILLVSLYFVECVAFPIGMATQVFTVGLAFIWGTVLGLRLRSRSSSREAIELSIFISLYSSFPTVSFCILLPIILFIGGGNLLHIEESANFGIPSFLPWPLNTILGFFVALMIGTVFLKTVITTGLVMWHMNRWERRSGG